MIDFSALKDAGGTRNYLIGKVGDKEHGHNLRYQTRSPA